MKKLRIYLDTSVIGGCCDKEFEKYSNQLIQEIEKGAHNIVISEVVVAEIEEAPDKVKKILGKLLDFPNVEVQELSPEMEILGSQYLESGIVTHKYQEDALHIAIATISRVDVLVSWNFKHIVNVKRIHLFNSVNLREGYSMLDIRSPQEVLDGK